MRRLPEAQEEAPELVGPEARELWVLSNGGRCPETGQGVLQRNCGCLATEVKAVPSDEGGSEKWRGSPGGSVGV